MAHIRTTFYWHVTQIYVESEPQAEDIASPVFNQSCKCCVTTLLTTVLLVIRQLSTVFCL